MNLYQLRNAETLAADQQRHSANCHKAAVAHVSIGDFDKAKVYQRLAAETAALARHKLAYIAVVAPRARQR